MNDLQHVGEVAAGEVARQTFGGTELARTGETASSAVAARAKAEIEARFIMALHRPRDVENFRSRLLKECLRPGFAAVAEYARPVGKEKNDQGRWVEKIAKGPSIRLLETAIQHFGNLLVESPVIYETDEVRIVRAQMTDLETNAAWTSDVVIQKRVEKRGFENKQGIVEPPRGRQVISSRINTDGDTTFLVVATDDEITVRQSALISKAQRKNGERLLPSDIINEAVQVCRRTIADKDAQDPEGSKRAIIDAFATLNVSVTDLIQFLGKPLDRVQPADLAELRGIYSSIMSAELTWEAALAAKEENREGSREEQQRVAAEKLQGMRKPGTTPAPVVTATATNNGSQAAQTGSAPATEAGSGGNETPGAAQVSGEPSQSGEQTLPKHIAELRAWRETLGGDAFMKVLGNNGYSTINEVAAEDFAKIQDEMVIAAQDHGKLPPTAKEEKATTGKQPLKFGQKPPKQ